VAKYRVIVDRSKCIACGAAPAACPEVFELGSDNGKNRVIDKYSVELTPELSVGVIPEELYDCARAGAEACPVDAIRVERIEGGEA
jgi:ferredoxin